MVNGFTTESINIEQSVKQGDALSCSLFILCMDPLIRKVNGDNQIEGLNIGFNGEYIDKVCGYTDDIIFIIKECSRFIKKLWVLRFLPALPLLGRSMPPMTWL